MFKDTSKELLSFLDNTHSTFHAVENIKQYLLKNNFIELQENKKWNLENGKNYFVTKNNSSIISFKIPDNDYIGFQIVASHSDSPTFKIKENGQVKLSGYNKLNVEKYGGMILSSWIDRPLSIAGRIVVKNSNSIKTILVDIDRDLIIIPNLAIHMNPNINSGYNYNPQVDMLPIISTDDCSKDYLDIICNEYNINKSDVLGTDLYLYNRVKGTIFGADEEFIASARLDDLQCAFASLKAFLACDNKNSIAVHCVFDNEEVGSNTKQGADSTFLFDTLIRINNSFSKSYEDYIVSISNSFMVSADNAHAVHPNHSEKTDISNKPFINKGIVIKHNANQRYTTDAVSCALFKNICNECNVPYQSFANRSDMPGGSTLGNIATAQVSINSVDIGLPQLAMHSAYETAGVKDTKYLVDALTKFYSVSFQQQDNNIVEII